MDNHGTESPLSCRHAQDPLRRILVVDDDARIRDFLSEVLSRIGYKVAVAANGQEALEKLLSQRFDVLLTDLHMPDMDGWALAHSVKRRCPEISVVMMSGDMEGPRPIGRTAGAVNGTLRKPFGLESLERALLETLDTRAALDP